MVPRVLDDDDDDDDVFHVGEGGVSLSLHSSSTHTTRDVVTLASTWLGLLKCELRLDLFDIISDRHYTYGYYNVLLNCKIHIL